MAKVAGGPNEHPVRPLRVVRPFGEPLVRREAMSLRQIFEAGCAAGSEATGVYVVWQESRGKRPLFAEDGTYLGPSAVTTPAAMGTRSSPGRRADELLPRSIYDRYKELRGAMDLESALQVIAKLGRSWDQEHA